MQRRFTPILMLMLCIACNSEQSTGPDQGLKLHVATQSIGTCSEQPSTHGKNQFPSGVTTIRVRLRDASNKVITDKSFTSKDQGTTGELLVQGIAVGDNVSVEVFGCSDGGVLWAGQRDSLSIKQFVKTNPEVFLTKRGVFNCNGSSRLIDGKPIGQTRLNGVQAYHTMTTLADGRVLFAGGIQSFAADGKLGVAGDKAALYHPGSGVFEHLGAKMVSPRALHHALPFKLNGRDVVLLIGGTKRFGTNLAKPGTTPLSATGSTSEHQIGTAIEAFDIATKSFVAVSGIEIPARLHAAAATNKGNNILVYAGGLDQDDKPTDDLYIWDGTTLIKSKMRTARAGHTITRLANGDFLIWGGNTNNDKALIGELLFSGATSTQTLKLVNTPNLPDVTAFHSISALDGRYIVAGGHRVLANTARFSLKLEPNLYSILFEPTTREFVVQKIESAITIAASQHTAISVANTVVLTGGITVFSGGTLSDQIIVVKTDGAGVKVEKAKALGGSDLLFPSKLAGGRAVVLAGESVLFAGGITDMNATNQILDIAYIWSAPVTSVSKCTQ